MEEHFSTALLKFPSPSRTLKDLCFMIYAFQVLFVFPYLLEPNDTQRKVFDLSEFSSSPNYFLRNSFINHVSKTASNSSEIDLISKRSKQSRALSTRQLGQEKSNAL